MRLIDADALKKVLCEKYEAREHYIGEIMLNAIDNAPTVEAYPFEQVQELVKLNQQFAQEIEDLKRPKGEWIFDGAGNMQCTNCNFALGNKLVKQIHPFVFSFCPDCGADMRDNKKETTFDDYLNKQLKDPEFKKEWEKLCDEDEQKGGAE